MTKHPIRAGEPSPGTRVADTSGRRRLWLLAALLIVITVAVYLPSLSNQDIWDDDVYLTQTSIYTQPNALARIWFQFDFTPQYYPLVFTTFWIEYHVWGLGSLVPYHLTNTLLHAVAAVLLWRVLVRLAVPGAWWCAAVFAVHPVQVESVAWITERKNVLSAVFYFSAALAWLRSARMKSLAWFAAALLSKTTSCTFPAALLLVAWWKTGRITRRDFIAVLPHLILGIAMGLLTAWVEWAKVGASGGHWELSGWERLGLAGHALAFYAGKLVWPHPLVFLYPRWDLQGNAAAHLIWFVPVLATVGFLWALRARIGRGPVAGALFFCGTLFPALGFFNVYWFRYSYVADHFQYLATPGVLSLVIAGGALWAKGRGPSGQRIAVAAGVVVLVVLGGITANRQAAYRDAETLWRDTLRQDPQSGIAHNNLGSILLRRGEKQEALSHFLDSVRIAPGPEALYNAGSTLYTLGRNGEATELLSEAVRQDPNRSDARAFLGFALYRAGENSAALDQLRVALTLDSLRTDAANVLATILTTDPVLRDPAEAVRVSEDMVERDGARDSYLLDTLAEAYAAAGRIPEAISVLQRVRAQAIATGDADRVRKCDEKIARLGPAVATSGEATQ